MWGLQVSDTVDGCLSSGVGEQRELWFRLRDANSRGLYEWLGEVRASKDTIIDGCEGELERRRVTSVLASVSEAEACTGALAALDSQCQLVAKRLDRVRNALAHGNPVAELVLESVRAYSRYRVETAWSLALEAFIDDKPLEDLLAANVPIRQSLENALASGIGPADFVEIDRLL